MVHSNILLINILLINYSGRGVLREILILLYSDVSFRYRSRWDFYRCPLQGTIGKSRRKGLTISQVKSLY